MWNHTQNCSPSGEENSEVDSSSNLKEKIERSLDLTHYLKYLDQLFSQEDNSESEYSDSDEDGKLRSFNEFLQPNAQPSDRPQPQYSQNHLTVGISNTSDFNHSATYSTAKLVENFQLEANISSSSLSSIDSGTSSLSLTPSLDNCPDQHVKLERDNNGPSRSPTSLDKNSSLIEDEKSSENASENDKKPQKKKKANKSNNESFTRHHKPSSGGKGNGSSGGGAGGLSTNGGSGESSGSSGGSSSSSQGFGGSSGSPTAKSRSGTQQLNLQGLASEKSLDVIGQSEDRLLSDSLNSSEELRQSVESENSLNTIIEGSESDDALLLDSEFADHYANELLATSTGHYGFETSGLNSFPLTAILDIREDEGCMSDYISMTAPSLPSLNNTSTMSQASTNIFSKIGAAATSSISINNGSLREEVSIKDSSKTVGGKRKLQAAIVKSTPDKFPKLTDKQKQSRIEMLNAKRRKVYVYISRKEIGKTQRSRATTFKESLLMKRKLAQACSRHLRRKALQSQKCMKESVCKAKRLTQEMEMYWKLVEREERDLQRLKDKEAHEKLRRDMEILNGKLQERKINFLITLLELFSVKLLKMSSNQESEMDILRKLDEDKDARIAHLDKYDSDVIKSNAQGTVEYALKEHRNLVELLDMSGLFVKDALKEINDSQHISQPQMFEGVLKNYQSVGLRWLKKLYMLGLNGILADEAGLGKKSQVIAFLTYLAETAGLWGPFLIVAPTSSLFKWQQDFERLSPRFNVISYWGKPMERKILRQVWEKNSFHTEDASFHVVITSHQIMASDLKYFSKIKWQYLILDDSQGSVTSSTKWMPLLSFHCRNKLLLSNSPRLNSQSHLFSYLYFTMPSLYDAQEELSDRLLMELESPTPTLDDGSEANHHVLRLRAVVQKFLLRRVKEEVEAEMTHDVDILVYCSLSRRQLQIYNDLLETTDLHNVLRESEGCKPEAEIRNRMKKVLHLSLQLRKTCNHPDLIEKHDGFTSFWMDCISLLVPKLVYEEALFNTPSSKMNFIGRRLCIYKSIDVHKFIFHKTFVREHSTWGFSRIMDLSCSEVEELYRTENSARLIHLVNFQSVLKNIFYESVWKNREERHHLVDYPNSLMCHSLNQSEVLSKLVFTSTSSSVYTMGEFKISSMPEAIEYRSLRSRKALLNVENSLTSPIIKDNAKKPIVRFLQPLEYPKFIRCCSAKVTSRGFQPLVTSRVVNVLVKNRENRRSLSEIYGWKCSHPNVWSNIVSSKWSETTPLDYKRLMSDSGKLQKLDEFLAILNRNGNRVLICTYIEETLEVLEDFLAKRKWKYARLGRGIEKCYTSDIFVYLFPGQSLVSCLPRISVDTVVFFDQDWDAKIEEQKSKIVKTLVQSNKVNWYRLICKGTIEERILRLSTERNIVSLALCKDVLENTHVSSVPSLRSLVTVLMSEYANKKSWRKSGFTSSTYNKLQKIDHVQIHTNKSFNAAQKSVFTKDIHSGAVNGGMTLSGWNYLNGGEGSDSASPSNSEELDAAELEADMDIKGYHDDDNYNFSMDEGYIGMSPDSFEGTVKSDYEEDSSPKKAKIMRGTGKRGRPPSRMRFQMRDYGDSQARRGPGRPRLKPVGPANQAVRGRRPGRPPLSKKAETISSGLTPLSSSQRVFGFYSSPDLELS